MFLLLCWRAVGTFGPPSDVNDVSFNSDSAILVLMANDDRPITIFNFYYYGASRWGAWAFLLAQAIDQFDGYHWTDKGLTIAQILWVLAGALVFARLSRRETVVAGLVSPIAVCLHREARYLLFELSQLYGFQTTALLLAWLGTRRVFDTCLEPASTGALRRRLIWLSFTVLSSFLAVWSSVASTAFLLVLVAVEGFLVYIAAPSTTYGRVLLPVSLTSGAVIAVTIAERLQKEVYHRYSARLYGYDFDTHFGVDSGYLVHNFGKQLDHVAGLSWWPLYVIPLAAALALVCGMVYAHLAKRVALRDRLKAILADDTTTLALGALSIAVLNFVMAVVVDHVRHNDYDDRYLTLTNLFGPISGMLTLVVLLKLAARSWAVERYVRPVLCSAGVLLLVSAFPRPHHSVEYQLLQETADSPGTASAERRAPGRLLGYLCDQRAADARNDDARAGRRMVVLYAVDATLAEERQPGCRRVSSPDAPNADSATPAASAIRTYAHARRPALVRKLSIRLRALRQGDRLDAGPTRRVGRLFRSWCIDVLEFQTSSAAPGGSCEART